MKEYDWFRIHIKKNGRNGYSVHVTSCLNSREFEEDFVPPLNQRQAGELLRKIEESLKLRAKALGHEKLMEIGHSFYGSIFSTEIERYFRECLKNAREKSRGLRIELIVDPLYLRRLPWELMHDGKDFLALSIITPIVRTFSEAEMPEFPEVSFPLGVLFIAASPVGPSVPIDVGGEIRLLCKGIAEAAKEGRVFLKCYGARKIKSQDFLDDVRSGKFHVLHVSSHGAFVEAIDKGLLQLEDEEGRAIPLSIDTLGAWIKDSMIQMVYLNACQTAVGSVRTPLADLSHVFLDRGVGAVVAMQFSVPDQSAITFCETFYSQLVQEEPIESALSDARKRTVDLMVGLDRIDWAIPTLYVSGKGILHVGGERKAKKAYKPLPELAPPTFVGRRKELNQLTENLVDPEVSVISVDGFGGIGKSSTVNKLVEEIGHLFTDVCWIDCRPKISHDKVVEEINLMLLFHGVGFTSDELAKYSPEGKNDRIAYALKRNDEGFLLVFDNFDSVTDDPAIYGLVKRIGEGKHTKVFVTVRTPMSLARKQRFFRLDKLKEDDALLLMRRLGEQYSIDRVRRAKDQILKDINAKVDGHPKATEVVIPQLKSKSVKTVLEELPQVLAGDIDPILEWSFNLLTAEEREFLFEISVYNGAVPLDALKAVHIGDYPIPVTELVEKNSLSYDTVRELYSLHPLVREYAYDQLRRERRRKLHRLAYRYFLSKEVKDPVSAVYHMYKAEDWKAGMYATSKILDALILRGFWTEARGLCEQGIAASRRIKNKRLESYFLHHSAEILFRLGHSYKAEEMCKQALDICQKLDDENGTANSLHLLAIIEESRGNYDEAEKLSKRSLEFARKIGDQALVARVLHLLAMIREDQGDYEEAEKLYKQSLEISQDLEDQLQTSRVLHQLAIIQGHRGNYAQAEELYKQSLEIAEKLKDKGGVAKSLGQLAAIHLERGNYREAERLYNQILGIFQELGDQSGISIILHHLAMIEQHRGNYDAATKLYKQSLEIMLMLGDQSGISKSLHQLAIIELLRQNYDAATKLYKQSLEIKRKLGDQSGISKSLHQLAIIEQLRQNYDRAEKLYKQSLKIKRTLGHKRGMALTFGQLGRLSEARDQLDLAKEYYEKTLEIFRQLGDKLHTDLAKKDLNRIKNKTTKIKICRYPRMITSQALWQLHNPSRLLWNSSRALG